MAGHSKWANIKRKKEINDKKKSNVFTKVSRMITLAVLESGGIDNPEKNIKLKLALDQAKKNNMPKDTIDRAIQTGRGENKESFFSIQYQAFGPGGAAFIIVGSTDNKNRSIAEVRKVLNKYGGSIGQEGSVDYLFNQTATVSITNKNISSSSILLMAEKIKAGDIEQKSDAITFYFPIESIPDVTKANGFTNLENGPEIVFRPLNYISVSGETLDEIEMLIAELENLDVIQKVFVNV